MKKLFLNTKARQSGNPYIIRPHSWAFGDYLISATFCKILNDNGIKSSLYDNYKDLVECPSFNPQNDNSGPVFVTKLPFRQLAESFNEQFNVSVNIPDKYPVPTKFVSMDIDSVDVAVTTRTGTFTKCKQWPYFNELFFLFDKYNISYIDLDKNNIRDYEFLNHIRKCKVYLGLDTGPAHYASKEGAGKTLIIQSGYCHGEFWAAMYDFEAIQIPVDCCPCIPAQYCENNYKCMRDISPEMVLESVIKKLD